MTTLAPAALRSEPKKRLSDYVPEFRDSDHWGPYIAEHAHGRCPCGAIVVLDSEENECVECGTLYDDAGEEL